MNISIINRLKYKRKELNICPYLYMTGILGMFNDFFMLKMFLRVYF